MPLVAACVWVDGLQLLFGLPRVEAGKERDDKDSKVLLNSNM